MYELSFIYLIFLRGKTEGISIVLAECWPDLLSFQKAVVEERFEDAAFLRDTAGTGLVSFNFYFEEKKRFLYSGLK